MTADEFVRRYGPWALVAGGSEGIGAAYARELARRGLHLVLVAHASDALEPLAAELRDTHGVQVRAIDLDLGRADVLEALAPHVDDVEVGLVIHNAAVSPIGAFIDADRGALGAAVDVNVRAPMLLAHEHGRRMARRGHGGIILMSSLSAVTGTAMVAAYAATKAFDRVLAEGLWEELGRSGVDVLGVMPGTTDTPGMRASQPRGGPRFMTADAVAIGALEALGGGRPVFVPGWGNRASGGLLGRLLPRSTAIRMVSRVTRRMYGGRGG